MEVRSVLLLRVSSTVDKDVDHPQFFDPPYPLKYLEAGLKGYPELGVSLLDCWIHPQGVPAMVDHTSKVRPQLVVVSASSFDVDVANDYVAALKRQKDAPLVVGIGQGYYLNGPRTHKFNQDYDAILLGEPEQEFFRFFDEVLKGNGSPDSWRQYYQACYADGNRFIVEDGDRLPFPSYTPEELQVYRSIYPVRVPKRVILLQRGDARQHRQKDPRPVSGQRGG